MNKVIDITMAALQILVVAVAAIMFWGAILLVALVLSVTAQAAEHDYQQAWCDANHGQMEVRLRGGRADCVTKRYAVEFDFAHKWKECIVQARWYALMTGKRPMCALIMGPGDEKYRDMMEFYLQSYEAWLRIEPIPK